MWLVVIYRHPISRVEEANWQIKTPANVKTFKQAQQWRHLYKKTKRHLSQFP